MAELETNEKISRVDARGITWINIIGSGDEEINRLKSVYNFHPLDLRDANITKKAQRPQISPRDHYLFLVILFPVYNRQLREIEPGEVDIFVGPDFLITLHDNKLFALSDMYAHTKKYEYYQDLNMGQGVPFLLYQILEKLFQNCFPMLDHIAEDNQNIENNIFKNKEREMVKEILIIKRNIVNFRTIMQSHRTIIKKILELETVYFPIKKYKLHYDKLLNQTKDIWEILEGHKETIDALQETNESTISFRINDVMKTLTLISVIFLPLTLIASLFGMNSDELPIVHETHGFWIVMILMFITSFSMIVYFKLKRWL